LAQFIKFWNFTFECNNLLSNADNSDGYGHTAGEKSRLHKHVVHWWKKGACGGFANSLSSNVYIPTSLNDETLQHFKSPQISFIT